MARRVAQLHTALLCTRRSAAAGRGTAHQLQKTAQRSRMCAPLTVPRRNRRAVLRERNLDQLPRQQLEATGLFTAHACRQATVLVGRLKETRASLDVHGAS